MPVSPSTSRSSRSSMTLRDASAYPAIPATAIAAQPDEIARKTSKTAAGEKPISPDAAEALELPENKSKLGRDVQEKEPRVTDEEQNKAPMTNLQKVITPRGELIYVGWDGPSDPKNPRNWSPARKWTISIIGFSFCSIVSITVSGYSVAVGSIAEELNASRELTLAGISLFTLMFGAAPLILAPLSEVYGRKWISIASAIIFWLFHLPQALAPNIQTMLVARFISGIGGSSAVSLVGGVLADLYANEDRGLPMAAFAFSAFAPTGLGPIIFGYVSMLRGMRLCFWILFAMAGVLTLILIPLSHETREGVLLSRKAKALRQQTGDNRYVAQADEERASLLTIMRVSLFRPVRLLFTEPVLQAFTLWISFAWAVLYLLLVSIPIVMQTVYRFNIGETGITYTSQIVGSVLGMFISLYCDKLYHRDLEKRGPEARMWTGCAGGILFPLGCWWWTWTAYASIHWIVPLIGVAILYAGLLLVYLTVFNYVSDGYTLYAASALSAMNVCRNSLGAAFPLFGTQVYDALGIHGAGSLVAGIATALSVVPFLALAYGNQLRSRSRFAKELARLEAAAAARA